MDGGQETGNSITEEKPSGLLGREVELGSVDELLRGDAPERAVLLVGEPGIGKTTVWEAGVEAARTQGMLVLVARPAAAEAGFSFTALADLLDSVGLEVLRSLPGPQQRALDVALLYAEPGPVPPEPRAIATGLLGVLRTLAGQGTVVVAIDDIQWLDAASAQALVFAARRLEAEPVRFLLAQRAGEPASLVREFPVVRLELPGLSLGAVRSLLLDRLGIRPSRRVLRQIADASGGNPLFALEVGRLLVERGLPAAGEDLPIPQGVSDLVGVRVTRLPTAVRRVLLALALAQGLGKAQLVALAGAETVAEAAARDVLLFDGDHVRAAHPLLATAARAAASAEEHRAVHRALADVVADVERRAHHLALGAGGPDAALAAQLADAATRAAARGAAADAADLTAHALRLTPPGSENRSERVLTLAQRLLDIAEFERAENLLVTELDALSPGEQRAAAHLTLSRAIFNRVHVDQSGAHLERALAESPPGSAVQARATIAWARHLLTARVERIDEAEQLAVAGLRMAEGTNSELVRRALRVFALARTLRGRSSDDLCERLVAATPDVSLSRQAVEEMRADRLAVRGRVNEARVIWHRLLDRAEELDETWVAVWLQFQLTELELRVGDWNAAEMLLGDIAESPSRSLIDEPAIERCRALLAAGRGRAPEAERWAARALETCERQGLQWNRLEALRARGIAAILTHEPSRAVESLAAVWEHTDREGIEEPGEFPVAPDHVEALLEAHRPDEAGAVTARLRNLAEAQVHPWGLVSVRRCEALLTLAGSQEREAVECLVGAAADYAVLGLRFDHARTLLIAGRAARRLRMWGKARALLAEAAASFAASGAEGWEAEARSEMTRIGGRSHSQQQALSPTERQVTALAADGLANKEIAERLAVSVYTVERHLTHAYEKLGVQSRAQLIHRLADLD